MPQQELLTKFREEAQLSVREFTTELDLLYVSLIKELREISDAPRLDHWGFSDYLQEVETDIVKEIDALMCDLKRRVFTVYCTRRCSTA